MAEENKTEILAPSGALPTLTPQEIEMMAADSGKQKFNIRELMVPVLKICNTAGGVMKPSSPDYVKGAKEGQLIDTLTLQPFDPPAQIIIVRFETTYIESKPKMGPTVKLWGTDPSGYQRAAGGDVGIRLTKDGNEIREVGTYYALLLRAEGGSMPCIMYLGSTSWKEARRLNALLASYEILGPQGPFVAPPYAKVYEVTTVPDSNEKNSWMTWKFNMGPITLSVPKVGRHLYERAKELEEAIDKRLTRIVGTADDERFAESQERAAPQASEVGSGPPKDEPPPPASEGDYGGGGHTQQSTVVDKAKDAPF
jgi:hypothetical protein